MFLWTGNKIACKMNDVRCLTVYSCYEWKETQTYVKSVFYMHISTLYYFILSLQVYTAADARSDKSTIDLNVGGMHFLTSLSTLTNFPGSYFGVMFSGRHDLKAMQCEDGSYFIDRDGTHFRCILNYLRNGEEVVESFSRLSADVVLDLLCEAKFYQLDGLVKALQREIDVITQDNVMYHFRIGIDDAYYSMEEIVFENKSMTGLSFVKIKFIKAVSFINCNLSNSVFHRCEFCSSVIFKNCLLGNTMFIDVDVVAVVPVDKGTDHDSSSGSDSSSSNKSEKSYNISFIHSNIERAFFLAI